VVYESKITLVLHSARRYEVVRGVGGIAPYISNLGARWRNVIGALLHEYKQSIYITYGSA
jgi:hypothetical protein